MPDVNAPSGTTITWSPDGWQLALADAAGLWVERADGSGKRELLKKRTTCTIVCLGTTAVWSPDGRTLAVGGVDPITTGFVRFEVSSGRVSQLRDMVIHSGK
jgi:WD40 repeat protein